MGKHLRNKSAGISFQNHHPGCMWGILHVLKYHNWPYIKKRVPTKNNGGRKHAAGQKGPENDINSSSAGVSTVPSNSEVTSSRVKEKAAQSTSGGKSSVKSRLKALILEEKSRRKGHHRSSTYPIKSQLTRTDSIHRGEHPELGPLADTTLNEQSIRIPNQNNEPSLATSSLDPVLPQSSEELVTIDESCGECSRMLTGNDLWHDHVDDNAKQETEYDPLFHKDLHDRKQSVLKQKTDGAKRIAKSASAIYSRHMLDSTDIFNMNKEFLLKILEDPGSPLAHYFHKQQAVRAKMGLTKSESFPLPRSSRRRGSGPSRQKNNQVSIRPPAKREEFQVCLQEEKPPRPESAEDICKKSMPLIAAEHRADGIMKLNQAKESADHSSLGSAHHSKKSRENQAVMKRFRDLKQKIKHAIKEGKKERYRITMDAVLHKIPHRKGFSKDLTRETLDQVKDPSRKRDNSRAHSTCKSGLKHIQRTTSLNESMDRYLHLFESSCHREAEQHTPEKPKLRIEEAVLPRRSAPKSLGRIRSSPELHTYYYLSEDSTDAFSSDMPASTVADSTLSISSLNEKKVGDISTDPEDHFQSDTLLKSESEDDLVDFSEKYIANEDPLGSNSEAKVEDIIRLSGNLIVGDTATQSGQKFEPETISTAKLEDSISDLVPESNFGEDTTSLTELSSSADTLLTTSSNDSEKEQVSEMDLNGDILQVQVEAKDKANFDYVRDILELSGFSGDEALGSWYSIDQPVDPLVYEEVGGCMLCDPDSLVSKEGSICNHQLLFDLINEVLMDIYEKSYCHCPRPLSCLSHIRPMPVRYHVLEEVWANISWYLNFEPGNDQPLDYVVSRDLSRSDGWMNLRFDTEGVGLELEELILEDLLEEVMWT
ncbi:hypothetical protein SLEP1_g17785 [Rubroshorea leprosula]|uniref:DUF4378 domain-containing protein n=1 Tax=Rubroshorea leprosula TaxID=152421 RepID=A0AAV5J196_9ROSI|nr:hypothetical protein SLEP1_g17785 [Rubroshorea leprosula]